MLEPHAVTVTFRKAGHYIFALGLVSFFGKLIIECLIYLHCYSIEFDLRYKKMAGVLEKEGSHLYWAPITDGEGDAGEAEAKISHWTHNIY